MKDITLHPLREGCVRIDVPVEGRTLEVWASWDWSLALDEPVAGSEEGNAALHRVHKEVPPAVLHRLLLIARQTYVDREPLEWVGELPLGTVVGRFLIENHVLQTVVRVGEQEIVCRLGPTWAEWRTDIDPATSPEKYDLLAGTAKHAVIQRLLESDSPDTEPFRLLIQRAADGT